MRLRCIREYVNGPRGLVFQVGEELEPSPQLRLFLLADAPGCFEVVEVKAPDAPPADKAVRAPRVKK
jgi:hypothetical protein